LDLPDIAINQALVEFGGAQLLGRPPVSNIADLADVTSLPIQLLGQ
jgi:hypothetical protein